AARPLPGSDFCLFHDPGHQELLAHSRSQGGAAPRRRPRRYPRTLDYKHVAELLSELFVDALNEPAPLDAPRLPPLTRPPQVLLQAVGRPKGTYEIHLDRTELAPDEAHLLRIYPPDPPELLRLLAAGAGIEPASPNPDPSAPSVPSDPSDPAPDPEPLNAPAPLPASPPATPAPPGPARPRPAPAPPHPPRPAPRLPARHPRAGTALPLLLVLVLDYLSARTGQ